mgnify:CR=1 FL=1
MGAGVEVEGPDQDEVGAPQCRGAPRRAPAPDEAPVEADIVIGVPDSGIPAAIHSCGSSSWAFDDFIEMGIDVVDTLQPEAAKMSPEYLKETFGGRLAFHGYE